MNLYHDQVIVAEIEYRQEQARRSWPSPRGERPALWRRAVQLLRGLRSPRASAVRQRFASHFVLGHGALAVTRP